MSENERPLLAWEHARNAHELGDRTAFGHLPRPPHCDPRILHHVDDGCDFCAKATEQQAERVRLDISNSGMTNRKYPCPADQARSRADYNAWPGNQPKTFAQLDAEAATFAQQLVDMGIVVNK